VTEIVALTVSEVTLVSPQRTAVQRDPSSVSQSVTESHDDYDM